MQSRRCRDRERVIHRVVEAGSRYAAGADDSERRGSGVSDQRDRGGSRRNWKRPRVSP